MTDLFDNQILCKNCHNEMVRKDKERNGFVIRRLICESCNNEIFHPHDLSEYERFKGLKDKEFKVKMRIVGNSYAVSIPKEIVSFMQEQEKIMDAMVRLCFEDFGRLSLNFSNIENNKNNGGKNLRVL